MPPKPTFLCGFKRRRGNTEFISILTESPPLQAGEVGVQHLGLLGMGALGG